MRVSAIAIHCSSCNICRTDTDHHSPLAGRCISRSDRGLFQCTLFLLAAALSYLAIYWLFVVVTSARLHPLSRYAVTLGLAIILLCSATAFAVYCVSQIVDGCLACCSNQTVQSLRIQRQARKRANSILKRNQVEQNSQQKIKVKEPLQKPQLVSELPESGGSRPMVPPGSWGGREESQSSLRQVLKSTDRMSLPVELDNLPLHPIVKYNNLKSRQMHHPVTFTLAPVSVPVENTSVAQRLAKQKSKTVK